MDVEVIPASIRTLVVGRADIVSYRDSVLSEARQLVASLEQKWAEADAAQKAALAAGEPDQEWRWRSQRTRRHNQLVKRRKFLTAVEEGYLPIPRLPAVRIEWTERLIPAEALLQLKEAKDSNLFEWFGVIDGTDATAWGSPRGRGARRDPILVGFICGEPFPLAWWR